jgi:hypothetical protein
VKARWLFVYTAAVLQVGFDVWMIDREWTPAPVAYKDVAPLELLNAAEAYRPALPLAPSKAEVTFDPAIAAQRMKPQLTFKSVSQMQFSDSQLTTDLEPAIGNVKPLPSYGPVFCTEKSDGLDIALGDKGQPEKSAK